MKSKALCMIASIAFYLITFMVAAEILLRTGIKVFFYCGFPAAVAAYFLIMGNVFHKRFQLNRWALWLSMNIAGYVLCWICLTIRSPMLWFNFAMGIFIVIPVTVVLFVVWSIVGIGFLFVWLFRRKPVQK